VIADAERFGAVANTTTVAGAEKPHRFDG
jgi:hypothetical protein